MGPLPTYNALFPLALLSYKFYVEARDESKREREREREERERERERERQVRIGSFFTSAHIFK